MVSCFPPRAETSVGYGCESSRVGLSLAYISSVLVLGLQWHFDQTFYYQNTASTSLALPSTIPISMCAIVPPRAIRTLVPTLSSRLIKTPATAASNGYLATRGRWATTMTSTKKNFDARHHMPDARFSTPAVNYMLSTSLLSEFSSSESASRIELAACYRLFDSSSPPAGRKTSITTSRPRCLSQTEQSPSSLTLSA